MNRRDPRSVSVHNSFELTACLEVILYESFESTTGSNFSSVGEHLGQFPLLLGGGHLGP